VADPSNSGRLAGRIALVTGGASGIGREACLLFAREGATAVVTDIDGAGATAREISEAGGRASSLKLDVT